MIFKDIKEFRSHENSIKKRKANKLLIKNLDDGKNKILGISPIGKLFYKKKIIKK